MFAFSTDKLQWINPPEQYRISAGRVEMTTMPNTDLWQRTYYGFRRTDAHMLVIPTDEPYFSFSVKAGYDGRILYDQCGMVIYLDEDNWFKCAMEYSDAKYQDLGSVVTNSGYSDFGTTAISPSIKSVYFRLSRRQSDFRLERSFDGATYTPMRVFHLNGADGEIRLGLYACSPSDATCHAVFTDMNVTECVWKL
jgi:regulation of enolase protein 1 (concanavalin A-like superfamily)